MEIWAHQGDLTLFSESDKRNCGDMSTSKRFDLIFRVREDFSKKVQLSCDLKNGQEFKETRGRNSPGGIFKDP